MIVANMVLSGLQVALMLQGYIQWPMANPGECIRLRMIASLAHACLPA